MRDIAIGVPVHSEPDRLAGTIETLHANTSLSFTLVLLPDGPDGPMREALETRWNHISQSGTLEARGDAACLNRLATVSSAGVLVLLESGCRVAPHWLDRLLAALEANPSHGIAGPSTNRCWNEQGAFPSVDDSPEALAHTSAVALARFKSACRTLEPLYSLSDFCYVVLRSVFDAAGPADEAYGLGPCWEMDFNIRAARAGFAGVWACSAFVHRAPFTARRKDEEARLFEASKRRYQDKFCGLRLSGQKSDYRTHCRGDACPNFAPRIEPSPAVLLPAVIRNPRVPVSCIMPTADRRAFVPRAIRLFLAQDYPNLELIIIDDGTDPVGDLVPRHPRIYYEKLPAKATVGAKRNIACSRASGDIIVHWDDDDWYPPNRVSLQVAALQRENSSLCGTSVLYYYDLDRRQSFRYRYSGASPWVSGNTLVYHKRLWQSKPFLDLQIGEDCHFQWTSPRPVLLDLKEPSLCVGTLHNGNASPKRTSQPYWAPEDTERLLSLTSHDLPGLRQPVISCIMPTYNRRNFVPLALRWFAAQTYPAKELLIVDDGPDPVGDLVESIPNLRYFRVEGRMSIGAKRNLACEQAHGEIIAHWDDDDWYAPERLAVQAKPILDGRADVTGLVNRFVLEMPSGRCWTTDEALHRRMFVGDVHGGTLVYSRSIFNDGIRYPHANLAEDAALLRQAIARHWRLVRIENQDLFVYLRHSRNAWEFSAGNFLDPSGWRESRPPSSFSEDILQAYRDAVLSHRG